MRAMLSEQVAVSPRRWIYLPISVKQRELDGNALLAFEAAERGWGVILCRKVPRGEPSWPCGVHLKKTLAPGPGRQSHMAWKAKGGKIDAWCEEGLVYPSAEEYGQRKLDPTMFGMVDHYYCWGQNQADDMIGKLDCDAAKIKVTGNPRFDLHRPELRTLFDDKVQRIKQKYAPLILINTKFSRYNNDAGSEAKLAKMRRLGRVQTDKQEAMQRGLAEFQAVGFEKFMELTEELSRRFPTHTIVVRPHPNESQAPWLAKAAGLPNVKVIFEGNVIEWILAAELSIQNNCMTGIEAYLLGKTTIAYRPTCDERFDLFLPNALSMQAFDLEELVELVGRALRGEEVSQGEDAVRKVEISQHFVANASGKRACERIMDTLEAMDVPERSLTFWASRLWDLRITAWDALNNVQNLVKGGEARRQFRSRQSLRIRGEELVSLLAKVKRATGRFGSVRVCQVKENVFCIF